MLKHDDIYNFFYHFTGGARIAYRCKYSLSVSGRPSCVLEVLPTNTNSTQRSEVIVHKPNHNFPSHFKKYDLTRLSLEKHSDGAHRFIINVYLPWQDVRIFLDKTFNETDDENMYDAFYEASYVLSKVFNVSRQSFSNLPVQYRQC